MTKTLTKLDVITFIHKNSGLPLRVVDDVVCDLLGDICQSLAKEQEVKIAKFGTFRPIAKRQRTGRNPKTGVECVIAPRRVVVFKASTALKDAVKNTDM